MNLDEKFGQIQCYNAIDSFLGKSVEKQNPYGVGPVSYTHLDVYKRQTQLLHKPLDSLVIQEEEVSFLQG